MAAFLFDTVLSIACEPAEVRSSFLMTRAPQDVGSGLRSLTPVSITSILISSAA